VYRVPTSGFSTKQVAQLTCIPLHRLNYWAKNDIFVPSICQSNGPGTRKIYSLDDIVQLRCLVSLQCEGASTQQIRKALYMVQQVMEAPDLERLSLLINDHGTILAVCKTSEGEMRLVDVLVAGGQQVLAVALDNLRVETQQLVLNFLQDDADQAL
jgi:DNA-binding transcriptional MerR regulator